MLVSFSLVLFVLGKYAWKPMLKALPEKCRYLVVIAG